MSCKLMIEITKPLNDVHHHRFEYPVSLIEGTVSSQLDGIISVRNVDVGNEINWPVIKREFRVFVLLKHGTNNILLQHGYYTKTLVLQKIEKETPYHVQPLYVVCTNDDGTFQSPDSGRNSINDALQRISLGCALLQTFTARTMQNIVNSGCTFHLPLNPMTHLPQCLIFKTKYTVPEIYSMTESEIWKNLAKELTDTFSPKEVQCTKFLAYLSCTRFDGERVREGWRHRHIIAATKGYAAIGE